MNGPDHYAKAERLIAHAAGPQGGPGAERDRLLAEAQVHATLALAAATIDATGTSSVIHDSNGGTTQSYTSADVSKQWNDLLNPGPTIDPT